MDFYLRGGQVEGDRGDLGKSGKVALAIVGNAILHQDAPVPANTDCSRLLRRTGSASHGPTCIFDKGGQADSEQLKTTFLAAFALFCAPACIVGQFEQPVKGDLVIAAIVLEARHGRVGKGVGSDKITTAHLDWSEV